MDFSEGLTFDMIGNATTSEPKEVAEETTPSSENIEEINQEKTIEDLQTPLEESEVSSLFAKTEGVDGESQEGKEESFETEDGDSPNFYASIATSLKEDGILNLLDDSDFEEIQDATKLASLFQKQVEGMLEEQQRRVAQALDNEVPVNVVKQYEQTISFLDGITTEVLNAETKEGEQLRGNIIVQDYMNKGFSAERANKEAIKSFEAGTDIEDARDALNDVKKFYTDNYNSELNKAKEAKENKLKEEKERLKVLEKKFLETEEPIKGIKLTEVERKRMLKQFTTFVGKDDSGKPLNAIQKYAADNPDDYQYILNTLFYLTDGFKELGKVVKKEVNNRTKSALSNLEKTLKNPTNRMGTGGIDFGNDNSPESFKGLTVALD